MRLNTDPNLDAPDAVYEALIEMHRDLSDAESALANARLILVLANHIGNLEVLTQAMRVARGETDSAGREPVRQEVIT
jgi:3-(3-hydroxy-phenyl)propionate hydroxylase